MQISEILHHKGADVVTILPSDTIAAAAKRLSDHRIGALVVRDRLGRIVGMLSERDIVDAIARHGVETLDYSVADLMTTPVLTCKPTDTVRDLMSFVTVRRIRHVPVLDGDRLVGIVSIGDLVKSRLDEKEQELAVFRDLSLARS